MDKNLPKRFLCEMKLLLKEEYSDFLKIYEEDFFKGISLNTKKISKEKFIDILKENNLNSNFSEISWNKYGFYIENNDMNISKSPLYNAGAFYIQEPSASSVVNYMDIKENMNVLDLCASPGGKTIQISNIISDDSLLVSNDINQKRILPLIKNIEFFGRKNIMVTNDKEENLSEVFPLFFHRILLDAPCSGEGMFRKDKKIIASYEKSRNELVNVQKNLLLNASKMLKVGGKLMYSTCTFNKEENENNILWFLENNKNFKLVDIKKEYGMVSLDCLKESARFFPHKLKGEGHFLCLMEKVALGENDGEPLKYEEKKYVKKEKIKEFLEFEKKFLNIEIQGKFFLEKNSLYLECFTKKLPKNIRIRRNGLYLGDIKNNKFNISPAFIRYLKFEDFKYKLNFNLESLEVNKYLKGETINLKEDIENSDYYDEYIVFVNKLPLGLAKIKNNRLKNLYNKNWRTI